jgi:crotonobetainyl-CoA:carnitine CoA-transferase CaiB-like acyl-CoA transferase
MPGGVYPCQDGFLLVMPILTHWSRFLALMKVPDLEKYNYPNDIVNVEYKGEVDAIWYQWCAERTKRQAMEECQAVKFFGTTVQTPKDAVEDPHFNERGAWVQIEHPVTGKQIYPGAPIKMGEAPWQVRMPAPTIGQHNIEVYCDQLGYSREDVIRLRESNVI